MPYGTINADIISTSSGQTLGAGNATSFKNRIINGGMTIDQRNAGASVTPTNGQYLVDRWQANLTQASKYTAQQNAGAVTPPNGFINYLGITSSSAYSIVAGDYFAIRQLIEGLNIADLGWGTANAKTVTLSFWVRSSLTGTFGGCLKNNANDRSYPFTYTISAANTWELETITIPGDTTGTWLTTNGAGMKLTFGFGVGSTYSGTAGAWTTGDYISATGAVSVVGTNGATFYITGVQLEVGSQATSFDFRSYGTELALCQRYYQINSFGWVGGTTSGFNYGGGWSYQTPMRTSPTGGFISSSASAQMPTTVGNFLALNAYGTAYFKTATGTAANGPYFQDILTFSAEL